MPQQEKALKEGMRAPAFCLPSSGGGEICLKDYREQKSVVLYFYPKDDTPGCTRQACAFRDAIDTFLSRDWVVLGVSPDEMASHLKFSQKFSLPFPLLSDADARISRAYGVYKLKKNYGREYWGIERTTFLIDPSGRIVKIFPRVKVDRHLDEILESFRSASPESD